jgi:iron(III) transport system substrate-binding protein
MKTLYRNLNHRTRNSTAQASHVGSGEVATGLGFIFGFEARRHNGYPVKSAAACGGTSYEVGGITMVKCQRNKDAARLYSDWLMRPAGQAIGLASGAAGAGPQDLQPDPKFPLLYNLTLIQYDFGKDGKAGERQRRPDRRTKEVNWPPR